MIRAALPFAVALAGIALAFATGFDEARLTDTLFEDRFHGFFVDQYPLFAALVLYGSARIAACARPTPWGLAGALAGVALMAAASLHPTFGGAVLRAGFGTGAMSFLAGGRAGAAEALGSLAAALTFGGPLGLGVALASGRWRPGRIVLATIARVGTRVLALWWATFVIGRARAVGFDAWPRAPLDATDAALAALIVAAALLPHALVCARPVDRGETRR